MPVKKRNIPILPDCPTDLPFAGSLERSFPHGDGNFTKALAGEEVQLSLGSVHPLPRQFEVRMISSLNSPDGSESSIPFARDNQGVFICKFIPTKSGVFSFRLEFTADNGKTWIKDKLPHSLIMVNPPQSDSLFIYTLIPNVSGNITDWIKELPRIASMGFNCIHLLPITELDASESPYSAKDLFQIDRSFIDPGSAKDGLSQLEDFIEEAKKMKISLCFDIVLNHIGVTSNIARKAPGWIVRDENQPDKLKRAGFANEHGWQKWDDLVLINYDHPSEEIRSEIWSYMSDYALFWAKYADYTGGFIRFDNLHSSHPGFVDFLTKAIHKEFPDLGILAEYFTNESTLLETTVKWGLNLSLATPWDYKFVPGVRDYLKYIHRVSDTLRYFMPATTHDSGTPAQEFGSAESTYPRYLAAALMGNGATGIAQGVEYGLEKKIDFIGRKEKMEFPTEARFAGFITKVNEIMSGYKAFRTGGNFQFVDNGHHAVMAVYRRDVSKESQGFLVICNFDTSASQLIKIRLSEFLDTHSSLRYEDLLGNEPGILDMGETEIRLPAFGVKVLKLLK